MLQLLESPCIIPPLNYHSSRDKNLAPLNTKEATPLDPACLIKWGTNLHELKTLPAVAGGEIRTDVAVELWTPQVHPQHALYTGYSHRLPWFSPVSPGSTSRFLPHCLESSSHINHSGNEGHKTRALDKASLNKSEFKTQTFCLSTHWRQALTAWIKVLLEKLTGSQLVKKFPTFYRNRRFITAFTSARHLSLSRASSIQSMPTHPTSWVLILSSHLHLGLPSGLKIPHQNPGQTTPLPPYVLHAQTISLVSIWSPELFGEDWQILQTTMVFKNNTFVFPSLGVRI